MLNRDVYQTDPSTRKIVNDGVANVNDDETSKALVVLRYELETFVCDGQYEKGMAHILETYLKNIDQAQQPAVWVSGFYGSGKSHLVKMLRALWVDTKFDDGASARGIANLPQSIRDSLKELSTQGKRHSGLHAVSGTLGAGASGSVRLALLRLIFKSVKLPEQYPVARFVMWLKNENILDAIRNFVLANGYDWQEELDNFYVAEGLHHALVAVKPNLFSSSLTCVETLNNLYPFVPDVSSDDMMKAIRQVLTKDGKFPLTLICLDEVQQYIGEDSLRSNDVQEVVETCCKYFAGKLLFVGTGQTAVTGTSRLKKLEGRFTIRVELSDADVDEVIRKVILAKKADSIGPINKVMQNNLGEISRHLANATISHRQDDVHYFSQDYPILPVRRRFWEHALRVLDQTGTDSQLRNQLSMVHKVIQTNLDEPLGHVVPADYLYFESADKLVQGRILPRKVHEKTARWIKGTEDEQIMARACGLVFLVNKLANINKEVGIQSTVDAIADLMVQDLGQGSSALRGKLPGLLDKCELLMRVGDEYRIQTEESAAWNDEFLSARNQLANEAHRVEAERDDRLRKKFGELVKKLSVTQGNSKVNRDLYPTFDSQLPSDSQKKVHIWVRDGWSIDENSVRVDARQAGNLSPTIFVFIPKRSADDLRHYLIDSKAAKATLDKRGMSTTAEGVEARASMETIQQSSEGKITELLDETFSGARVFQGGGNEILGNNLQEIVLEASQNALQRLYSHFPLADHSGWEKVYVRAKQGAPDALKAVGDDGEPAANPVCKAILAFIARGKKGSDIREHFEAPSYGWPRDALDGALQVLLIAGLIRAEEEHGQTVDPKAIERKAIGKILFKVESATVPAPHRIQVRKLLQQMGCHVKSGEELSAIPDFLSKLLELAYQAGGDAPKPPTPDISSLEDIRLTVGNEQILSLYNRRDELKQYIEGWSEQASRINERWPFWTRLQSLLNHSSGLKVAQELRQQVETLKRQRLLLQDPDLVEPMLKLLQDALRKELSAFRERFTDEMARHQKLLDSDASWSQLNQDEREALLHECQIAEAAEFEVGTYDELVGALDQHPLKVWQDRIDALNSRFARVHKRAAEVVEPKTQTIAIPRRMLKTEKDLEEWVIAVKEQLKTALSKGPVVIS